jgi:hypothetical protein
MPTAIIPTIVLYEHIRSICEKMKIAASLSKADYFHSILIVCISSVEGKWSPISAPFTRNGSVAPRIYRFVVKINRKIPIDFR